jgi:hypothetical protein
MYPQINTHTNTYKPFIFILTNNKKQSFVIKGHPFFSFMSNYNNTIEAKNYMFESNNLRIESLYNDLQLNSHNEPKQAKISM